MRKTSSYARSLARQRDTAKEAARAEAEDNIRSQIIADVRSLALSAGIHAWTGNDSAEMINKAGRLVFVVAHAAEAAGMPDDTPDIRILRGTANALEAFTADQQHPDRYRQSLQSGLAAINRLLPLCDDFALLAGAAALEVMLDEMTGVRIQRVAAPMTGAPTC